jgi:CRP/FNR family cyclic AMP-dependent transcriptional regulator
MADGITRQKSPKLSISERIAASAYGAKAQWPSGFQLYQRGAVADGVFIVLHGHIILRSPVKGGRGFVSAIAMAGETFGAEGLAASNAVYRTDANAADEAETLYIGSSQFRAFLREQPAQAIALVSQIMAERSMLLERLYEMAAMNVEERLVAALLRLNNDVAFTLEDGSLKLDPQHHRLICEMVGATRESITLAMSRMIAAGDAMRQGSSFVINPTRLRARLHAARYETTTPIEVVREMGATM